MLLRHQLPQVYSQFLPREILDFGPEETKATCDNCAMSRPQNKAKIHYRADLKCCTFHPLVPNYMVGAILLDETATAAHKILKDKIARREYSLPIGMVAPVKYQVEFNARQENDFGQREDWLCPYYEKSNGNCNIWKNRGVVCTTFFCKSSYGKVGLKFWESLSSYLWYVELALLEEALTMLDFSPRQVMTLLDYHNRQDGTAAEKKSWVLPEKTSRELWNGYLEDQEGFFIKAHNIIANMDKTAFHEAVGEQGLDFEEQIFALLPRLVKESSK
jgi:Fe-S-cluster containining protein